MEYIAVVASMLQEVPPRRRDYENFHGRSHQVIILDVFCIL